MPQQVSKAGEFFWLGHPPPVFTYKGILYRVRQENVPFTSLKVFWRAVPENCV